MFVNYWKQVSRQANSITEIKCQYMYKVGSTLKMIHTFII